MSEPISDARLTELWQIVGDFALLADDYRDIRLALRELQSLRRERAEQETLLAERNRQNAACWTELDRLQKLEALLFDGHAVLTGLSRKARARTSPENVSDVLDALVELTRRKEKP